MLFWKPSLWIRIQFPIFLCVFEIYTCGFEINICSVQNIACCLELILVWLLFLTYICGVETLHVVSEWHYKFLKSHTVMYEKQGIFVYVVFHSLSCYFEIRLCRSDFASCCFRTTPCGFENTHLVETISYHILPIISIPWHVKSKLSPVVSGLCHVVSKRHRVASTFHYVILKMMCSVSKIHMSSREIVVF